jgi:hypothetical protein
MDRAIASGAIGREFESLRAHHFPSFTDCPFFPCSEIVQVRDAFSLHAARKRFDLPAIVMALIDDGLVTPPQSGEEQKAHNTPNYQLSH